MGSRLRVVSFSHSASVDGSPRLRYVPLIKPDEAAGGDGIDLTLVVPKGWREYGKPFPEDPPSLGLPMRRERIRCSEMPIVRWYLHYYPDMRRILDELQPDVIHLWEEPWSVVAAQAVRLRNVHCPRAGLVLETDQNVRRRLLPPFEQIRRYTLHNIDALIVRHPEALAVSQACGYRGPSRIVEYCVDGAVFHPGDRDAARAAFGARGFTIGYAGRIIAAKGLDTVLDAMMRADPSITLLVLGDGPDADALAARVQELGLSGRVRIHPSLPLEGVARFMNALDAFVLMSRTMPTWKEQFGRVIMEAQSCGIPVIGSSSGAIPSVIGPGGWVVEEDDVAGLQALLDRLVRDPSLLATARAGCRQQAQRFSQATVGAALRDVLELAHERRTDRVAAAA